MFPMTHPCETRSHHTILKKRTARVRNLFFSIYCSVQMMEDIAGMDSDQHSWRRANLGHDFTRSQGQGGCGDPASFMNVFRSWMRAHEDAQVMIASILVVVGLWWLVRTILTLLINLLCPMLVVLLAVMCVPQLRGPLLGQNYPVLANTLKTILSKLAENIP